MYDHKYSKCFFDIRASYVSYSFEVVSGLKETDAVRRIVLRTLLFPLSQSNWMWKLVTFSLHCFSLRFSPSLFAEIIIKCVKRTLQLETLTAKNIRRR